MNNDFLKLKTSLCDAIDAWIDKTVEEDDEDLWLSLDSYIGDNTKELMADAAFNILLAQHDLSKYLRDNDLLKT